MLNVKRMLATQGAAVMLIGTPELARRIFYWHSRYVSALDKTPAAEISTFDDVENSRHQDGDEDTDHDGPQVLACLRRELNDKLALVSWRISALPSLDQLELCPALQRLGSTDSGDTETENAEVQLLVRTGAILRQVTGSLIQGRDASTTPGAAASKGKFLSTEPQKASAIGCPML